MVKKSADENDPKGKASEHEKAPEGTGNSKGTDLGTQAKEAVEKVYRLAQNVQRDTIAYVVLVIGLVLLFMRPDWGGALVGIVFGTYFADELIKRITQLRTNLQSEGQAKSIALGGVILASLIVLPTFLLGVFASVGVVALITRSST